MDMGNREAKGAPKCTVDSSFRLAGRIHELHHLHGLLVDDQILAVWEFSVAGEIPASGGVCIAVRHARAVEAPAERPRRAKQDDESGEEESSDQERVDEVLGTGKKVVDTDEERSAGSLGSSSSGDSGSGDELFCKDLIAKPVKPEGGAGEDDKERAKGTVAQPKFRRSGIEPLWSDPYFIVWDHPGFDYMRMDMRHGWREPGPVGMGTTNCTKQVTPRLVGDSRSDPIRSLLLLRAWALWRSRQNGWADGFLGIVQLFFFALLFLSAF